MVREDRKEKKLHAVATGPQTEQLEDRLLLNGSITNLQIVGDMVVYQATIGNNNQIFVYDDQGLRQISDDISNNINPHCDGTNIVWQSKLSGESDYEIFWYNGSTTTRMTTNTVNDTTPQTDGEIIAWLSGSDGAAEVYTYNYTSEIQQRITTNTYEEKSIRVAGGRATWYAKKGSDNEIFYYDGSEVHQITSNSINDVAPKISESHIAWRGLDTLEDDDNDENPDLDDEIYLYDINSGITTRVTQNTTDDKYPGLSTNTLFWSGKPDGEDDYEVFAYHLTSTPTTEQLTYNSGDDQPIYTNPDGAIWTYGTQNQIYGYSESGGVVTKLTNDATSHNNPAVSDQQVVWSYDNSIWLLDTTGTEPLIEFTNFGYLAKPELTMENFVTNEGNSTYELEILVYLSGPTDHTVTIDYSTQAGSATEGSVGQSNGADYLGTSGTLTFLPGEVSRSITVTVLGDLNIEGDEDFIINISSPVGADLSSTSATITLAEDDTPDIYINDAEVIELDDGEVLLEFVVYLSRPVNHTVFVNYKTFDIEEDGDDETDDLETLARAGEDGDYLFKENTLEFSPGDNIFQTIQVVVNSDTLSEYHEKMKLMLFEAVGANIADNTAIGTILNDDVDISFSESTLELSKNEGDDGTKTFTFTVELSNPSAKEVTVNYRVEDYIDGDGLDEFYRATGDNGDKTGDYKFTSGLLTFAPGDTNKTFSVTVYGDEVVEEHEKFKVILSNASNAEIEPESQQTFGEIFDDDAPRITVADVSIVESAPLIEIYDLRINEGEQDTSRDIEIHLTLARPVGATAEPVTVHFDLLDVTTEYGSDYTFGTTQEDNITFDEDLMSGTVTFGANETNAVIHLTLFGDNDDESNETLKLRLSRVEGEAALGERSTSTVVIYDDDYTTTASRFYCYDYRAVEGDDGLTSFQLAVAISSPLEGDETASVDFSITDISTASGVDYEIISGETINFVAGQYIQYINVSVIGDEIAEGDKSFLFTLSNPSGASIGDSSATILIIDDDPAEHYLEFTVKLDKVSEDESDIVVNYHTADYQEPQPEVEDGEDPIVIGSATENIDYQKISGTLTFAYDADDPVLEQTIRVPIYGDRIAEDDETFRLNLEFSEDYDNTSFTKIINEYAIGTIENDDTEISFEPTGEEGEPIVVRKKEGNSGTTIFEFYLKMSKQIDDVTVYFSTSDIDGQAISATGDGQDYIPRDYYAVTFTKADRTDDDDSEVEDEYYALVTVSVRGDLLIEGDEEFLINLISCSSGTFSGPTTAKAIILDDDTPTISMTDIEVVEGDGDTKTAIITVELSRENDLETVTVDYSILEDSEGIHPATGSGDNADFVTETGTLTFAPGETTKTITVTIKGDTTVEPDETFLVKLTGATGAIINDGDDETTTDDDTAVVTIKNDDTGVMIESITVTEGSGLNTTVRLVVKLTEASTETVSVWWQTQDGDNSANTSDYIMAGGNLQFLPGETQKEIFVDIIADYVVEPENEYFYVKLTHASNATIMDGGKATVTIRDDDMPWLTIDDAQIVEGDEDGTVYMVFTVTRHGERDDNITVDYRTEAGTANASDFFFDSGYTHTLTFTPGGNQKQTISIPIISDTISEPDEIFSIILYNSKKAKITGDDGIATGTIKNDDARMTITDSEVTEGNDGQKNLDVTITLEHASAVQSSATVSTSSKTATEGEDFTALNQTVIFAPGETTKTISVSILGDTMAEFDEEFNLLLSNLINAYTVDDGALATGTILNDDADPVISVSQAKVAEGTSTGNTMELELSLSNPSAKEITVELYTTDDTALDNTDYDGIDMTNAITVTFQPGQTTATVEITVYGDTTPEPDKYFNIHLVNPQNASVDSQITQATIQNDDTLIQISDAQISEGTGGQVYLYFYVTLSEATSFDVEFSYYTENLTAIAGEDYSAASGTTTIHSGNTERMIQIPITTDNISEGDEQFLIKLENSRNATIETSQATITIEDDEQTPKLSVSDVQIAEGNNGSSYAQVTVSISNPASWDISVQYVSANITAESGSDYQSTSGTLNFSAGQTQRTVLIQIIGDTLAEIDETFALDLLNPNSAEIDDGRGVITIINDDSTVSDVSVSIEDASVLEGDTGTTLLAFTVTLSKTSEDLVTVYYMTADGTATLSDDDYEFISGSIVIPAGQLTGTIYIEVNGDSIHESDETFMLNLTSATNAAITDNDAIGTITNDDDAPALTISDISVTETDADQTATLTVTLSGFSGSDVSFDWLATAGTALADTDYIADGGNIIIPAGQTSATITITIIGDTEYESAEYFDISLSNIAGAAIGSNTARVTITDNDQPPAPMADLQLSISKIVVPALAAPGQKIKVKYILGNIGEETAIGSVSISVYCSSDLIIDASDLLLAQSAVQNVKLKPGKSKAYAFNIIVPENAPAEDWNLIAVANIDESIPQSDMTNDTAIAAQTFNSPWQFGNIPGGANISLPVTDSTGQSVKLTLAGGGWGEVVGRENFTQILLHSTTEKSVLVLKAKSEIQAGAIIADGPLKVLNAPTLSLSADSSFTAGSIKLLDITGGASISLGAWPKPIAISLDEVRDASIFSQSDINKFTLSSWEDSDASGDSINAPTIKVLQAKGNMDASIETDLLTNAKIFGNFTGDIAAGSAGKITIKGDLTGSDMNFTDTAAGNSVAALKVSGIIDACSLVAASNINSVQARGVYGSDFFAGIAGVSGRRAESADDFASLSSINKLVITGSGSSTDRYISDSNFSAASIGKVSLVNGNFAGSQVSFNALGDGSDKEIRLIKHVDKQDKTLNWQYPPKANQPFDDPYDIIRIL